MTRVPTFFHQVLRGHARHPDLNQPRLLLRLVFAKVRAEPALPFVYRFHSPTMPRNGARHHLMSAS